MFTGLIEHVGRVAGVTPTKAGRRLVVDPRGWEYRPAVGDSIAVAGCCLTLAERVGGGMLGFDVVPETLAKTNLAEFVAGRRVNLEHAATAGTLMGGHVVQGHVDGVGRVEKNEKRKAIQQQIGGEGEAWVLRVGLANELMAYMVPKGSVTLDGVSLTLAAVDVAGSAIEIALIPTTLAKTTLGELRTGDLINVEADVMAKTVVHYLKHFERATGVGADGGAGDGHG
jgi:riboflavin synthase